jgi:hypothetical protein
MARSGGRWRDLRIGQDCAYILDEKMRPIAPNVGAPRPNHLAGQRSQQVGGIATDLAIAIYIGIITLFANSTGLTYVLFPELGALTQSALQHPRGKLARAWVVLPLTPLLTAIIGIVLNRALNFGVESFTLSVATSILFIALLKSPVLPAISAGVLPLSLDVTSWTYPSSVFAGAVSLTLLAAAWRQFVPSDRNTAIPNVARLPGSATALRKYSWVPFFAAFVLVGAELATATGYHLLLYPPLAVIAYQMFAQAATCPWARRPLILPVVCTLSAAGGEVLVGLFGAGPLAACSTVLLATVLLRLFRLSAPPVVAVGLLPLMINDPVHSFPIVVGVGTLLLTATFKAWRQTGLTP